MNGKRSYIFCDAVRLLTQAGVPVRLPARGGSMWPAIASGDAVVVGQGDAGDLRPDDLALVEIDGRLYAHRFVGWRRDDSGQMTLEFRGDASTRSDRLVPADAVIGRVVRVEPRPGPAALRHLRTLGLTSLGGFAAGLTRRLRPAWLRVETAFSDSGER